MKTKEPSITMQSAEYERRIRLNAKDRLNLSESSHPFFDPARLNRFCRGGKKFDQILAASTTGCSTTVPTIIYSADNFS